MNPLSPKPTQRPVDRMTVVEATAHLDAGHFPRGSMGPKMQAAINFLCGGGHEAIITSPHQLAAALRGEAGTFVVPG